MANKGDAPNTNQQFLNAKKQILAYFLYARICFYSNHWLFPDSLNSLSRRAFGQTDILPQNTSQHFSTSNTLQPFPPIQPLG